VPAGVGSSCGMAGPTSANYDVTANGALHPSTESLLENMEAYAKYPMLD
jgi:hypothetical protein